MHYANGRAAKIGDLVRGKGYNLKHEIIGIVINAQPISSACNCTVACFGIGGYGIYFKRTLVLDNSTGEFIEGALEATPSVEYGQLDAFVALDPKTGEVLPPEGEVPDAIGQKNTPSV